MPKLGTTRPHPARVYDYLLAGKDHFAVDRAAAEMAMRAVPTLRIAARANRAFLGRAVRYLAAEAGIRPFLDIGTGLPSACNVHEVAQGLAPECRVVYADNDPLVPAHARALLASDPQGRTAYIQADLRGPAGRRRPPAPSATPVCPTSSAAPASSPRSPSAAWN
jgi:S-adenosyl methyltransferase